MVQSVLKYHTIGLKNVVSQDQWSLVAGSLTVSPATNV